MNLHGQLSVARAHGLRPGGGPACAYPRSPSASAITAVRPSPLASRVPPRRHLRWPPAPEPADRPLQAERQPGADPLEAVVGRLDRLDRRMEQLAQVFA